MSDRSFYSCIIAIAIAGIIYLCLVARLVTSTYYNQGVYDTYKEAFEHGLMTKEITDDDKVIYRWIETHKIGY